MALQFVQHGRWIPAYNIEYFVGVDGASSDDSRDIVAHWLARSGIAGVVVDNPRRRIPISLNRGVAALTPEPGRLGHRPSIPARRKPAGCAGRLPCPPSRRRDRCSIR